MHPQESWAASSSASSCSKPEQVEADCNETDQVEECSSHSSSSKSSRASMTRKGSELTDESDGYGPDDENEVISVRPRRASLHGASRRASAGPGGSHLSPVVGPSRRASLSGPVSPHHGSMGSGSMHSITRRASISGHSRRGSNGYGMDQNDHNIQRMSKPLAPARTRRGGRRNDHGFMTRRGSGGARMPPEHRGVYPQNTGDSLLLSPRRRGSTGGRMPPERRGVYPQATGDSVELNAVRRGSVGGRMPPESRGVYPQATGDSVELNALRRGSAGGRMPPESRGVSRQNTADSVELAQERRSSLTGHMAPAASHHHHESQSPRVYRMNTADSMELAQERRSSLTGHMAPAASHHYEGNSPHVYRQNTADSMELTQARRSSATGHMASAASHHHHEVQSPHGHSGSLPPDHRHIDRHNTTDSMELAQERRSSATGRMAPAASHHHQDGGQMRRRSSAGGRAAPQHHADSYHHHDDGQPPRRPSTGINPQALARMNRRASGSGLQQEDDAIDYGYEETQNAHAYGYESLSVSSHGLNKLSISNHTNVSTQSNQSRRRNSCLIRNGKPHLLDGPPRVSDSELSESEGESDSDASFGYARQPSKRNIDHYESDQNSESDRSFRSSSSRASTRSRRRNSYFVHPDQDPRMAASLLDATPRMSDRDMVAVQEEKEEDDLHDPDSLLSRSGYYNQGAAPQLAHSSSPLGGIEEGPDDEDELLFDNSPYKVSSPVRGHSGANHPTANASVRSNEGLSRQDSRERIPFTTPHAVLTEDKLNESQKQMITSNEESRPKQVAKDNWGAMELSESDPDSEEMYGVSMYNDSKVYEEIDKFKQRARRRASLDKSRIYMGNRRASCKVPSFKPAHGCENASDFIVRCFAARLRTGITVIKHNRSRWSKSQYRILYLLPDGKTLSWKPLEDEADKGKRPKLDLTMCKEVRHAWSQDPAKKRGLGTAIIRKRCKDGMANRSFALIFARRTLDITALSNDQCKVLLEGFSALCFRLQLDRIEEEGSSKSFTKAAEEDWASTIYGESTASLSLTNTTRTTPVSPWGL